MGMKLKSGADLCGFQLTNFCVQGEASAPSDAALGRKYFHTNATDDVATGISLLNRERIYLGEGAWRATAYLDDIAGIQTKLDMILGDVDLDGVIENMNEVIKFLEDNKDTENLMTLLNNKLDKTGGTMTGALVVNAASVTATSFRLHENDGTYVGMITGDATNVETVYFANRNNSFRTLLHKGNYATEIGDYYLKSSGGTISGSSASVTTPLTINTTYYYEVAAIGFNHKGVNRGGVGLYANGAWLVYGDGPRIGIRNDGKPVYALGYNQNGYDLIHSGNIGSYKAGGLAHSNGTVGATVDANGLVTIENTTRHADYAPLNVINNLDTAYSKGIIITAPNIPQNQAGAEIIFGKQFSKNNVAAMSFFHAADDINKNAICFGFHSTPNLMRIIANGNVLIGTTTDSGYKLDVQGDTHITGNLIVDGEISAGGAGAEEGTSGSGSAEGVSEIFTPTSTSMAFDHNLGEDVIVQVYEKSGNVWNMVIVDTEITSATRVTLRFGKTETTQHKVVIMGV